MQRHIHSSLAIALVALVGACGGDSLSIDKADAEGSVGGMLVDAATRTPIPGVSVSIIAGGEKTFEPVMSAEDGSFAFNNVPAGPVLVSFTAAGYHTAWVRGDLANSAGEFPAGNSTLTIGPIGLVSSAGSFKLRVLDPDGAPVSMYTVSATSLAQYVDLSSGTGVGTGQVSITATSDANGYLTFQGMPDFYTLPPTVNDWVTFLLPPYDANGDTIYEYAGGVQQLTLRSLRDPTPNIILDDAYSTSLSIRASNIGQLSGAPGTGGSAAVLGISDTIHVSFNLPVQNTATVNITDERGNPINKSPSISIVDDNLTIAFGSDPLLPGEEYNIHIHAVAAVGDRLVTGDFVASFFTRGLGADITATATRDTNDRVFVTFSEPVGYPTTGAISLSGGNCVVFFNTDLNAAGGVGDAPNELTGPSCNIQLLSAEPDPIGPVGRSGYTKHWEFTAPKLSDGTTSIAAGVSTHLLFTRIGNAAWLIERPDGTPIGDMSFNLPARM